MRNLLAAPVVGLLLWLPSVDGTALAQAPKPPYQRLLSGNDARRVAELQEKVGDLVAAGKFAEAQGPAEEVAVIQERAQGADHWQAREARRFAQTLGHLAALPPEDQRAFASGTEAAQEANELWARGKYAEAQPLYEKALAACRRALGEDHPYTATGYGNLANNLEAQGKHAEAQPLLEKALAIGRKVLGDDHPSTAAGYNNLAYNLNAQGKHAEAQPLYEKALAIRRKVLGEDHPYTASGYNNLGSNLQAQGKYAEAQPLFEEALAIQRRVLGENHPYTASGYNNLAYNLKSRGKYAKAQSLYEKALAIYRKVLGEGHPSTATGYNNLAMNLRSQGQYAEAEKRAAAAARSYEAARLVLSFTGLDRAAFAGERSPLPLLAALLARNGKPAEAWRRLEEGLARGLLDDLAARQGRPLTADDRRREEELLGRLHVLDRQLTALSAGQDRSEARQKQAADIQDQRAEAQRQLDELEAQFARKYGPVASQVYNLDQVQAQLPEGAALLAWVDLKDEPHAADSCGDHWACLLRRRGPPAWVRLRGSGPGGAWTEADTRLAAQVRGLLSSRPGDVTADWQGPAGQLYRQRLTPLAKYLGAREGLPAVRHLIVLPSPGVAGIPTEALLAAWPGGAPALTVGHAPSATLFAWLRERRRDTTGGEGDPGRLLALGDPAFTPRPQPAEDAPLLTARGEGFTPLPGSRREVEAIARLFPRADTLLGSDASEQRLDQLAGEGRLRQYRYLHLATHGFIDPAQPMRSFLALSQNGLSGPAEQVLRGRPAYSGRLTAADILGRWRLDADLVTLSACESGLGKYEAGEGYVGFAQGLLLAGAHSMVLSEWSVDDDATALLMTRFYQNLLGKRPGLDRPLPKAEGLREAKDWLRHLDAAEAGERLAALPRGTIGAKRPAPAGPKPYAHPYYWAGFILVGDSD
jgi:CHAT domain-containing protein/tetratricopeptide (TPR) repeat protein